MRLMFTRVFQMRPDFVFFVALSTSKLMENIIMRFYLVYQ